MSDESFSPMHPAIPSRATGEVKPLQPAPMFEEPPARPRKKKAKDGRRKVKRLAPAEIKRINSNRKKNMKKRKAAPVRKVGKHPALAAPYGEPKNPNRPLEMKNRLQVVLTAVAAMSKAEATAFTGVMQHLEDMSRPSRKRIISALAQVYT